MILRVQHFLHVDGGDRNVVISWWSRSRATLPPSEELLDGTHICEKLSSMQLVSKRTHKTMVDSFLYDLGEPNSVKRTVARYFSADVITCPPT